jgi:type III restriction enzyme
VNRHVNAIAGRLSLRPPQRQSLEILDRICEIAPPSKGGDLEAVLAAIRSEYPSVTNFERDFPSLCFALATGVGKTRLMGAFIAYLHLAYGINNFFVMAPNLTIYNKLIADFSDRGHAKYVFRGIAEFATSPPETITNNAPVPWACCRQSPSTFSIFPKSTAKYAAARARASNVCPNTSARAISTTWLACPTWCC